MRFFSVQITPIQASLDNSLTYSPLSKASSIPQQALLYILRRLWKMMSCRMSLEDELLRATMGTIPDPTVRTLKGVIAIHYPALSKTFYFNRYGTVVQKLIPHDLNDEQRFTHHEIRAKYLFS